MSFVGAIQELEALAFAARFFVEATAASVGEQQNAAVRRALAMTDLLARRANKLVRYACEQARVTDPEAVADLESDVAAAVQRVAELEQEQEEVRDILRTAGLPVTGHGLAHDVREALRLARGGQ